MIVRDAVSTIEATVESALPFIDTWTIVDTGSVDGTAELVESMLRGVPGTLRRRAWHDFGTNRSEALHLASGSADYLLLLDADETISCAALPTLWMDGYDFHLVNHESWEPRLIRADLPWRFLGAARDRLSCAVPVARRRLHEAAILHHQTPDARADALERDARLLRASLEGDPTNLLSRFELALVLLERGDTREPVNLLEQCRGGNTWDELTFCSSHQLARIAAREDPESGMRLLLEAWESRPSRVEPLFDLARLANELGRPTRALLATSVGITLNEPADDLMVQPWVYQWRMRLEHAVTLHLVGRSAEAVAFVDKLIAEAALPARVMVDSVNIRQSIVDASAQARGTHLQPEDVSVSDLGAVPLLTELVGTVSTVEIGLPVEEPWHLASLSVAGSDAGFALQLTAASSHVKRHFLQTHDATGARVLVQEILDQADRATLGVPSDGLDDARLFWWEDAWRSLANGHGQSFLVDLDASGSTPTAVRALTIQPGGSQCDLMPVVVNGRLFVVTGLDPFEVVAWDRTRAQFQRVTRTVSSPGLAGWVGGSPGLRTADGFLFVIRRVCLGDRFELVSHRFLAVDDRLCPLAASREFVFGRYGSEACLGLARRGQDLLCSYTSPRGRGWLTAVRSDLVMASLLPLTSQ